jgi:hypothetical protein
MMSPLPGRSKLAVTVAPDGQIPPPLPPDPPYEGHGQVTTSSAVVQGVGTALSSVSVTL